MDAWEDLRPGEGRFGMLVRWLGLKDTAKKEKAVEMLCRVGKPVTPLLVCEATKPGKRSQHRVAILDVVRRIGGPFELDEVFALQSLLRHRVPAVRQKAEETIMAASPCGAPDSPETAAMMRAFNPLLRVIPHRPIRKTRNSEFKECCREAIAAAKRIAKRKKAELKRQSRKRGKEL